MRVLKEQHGQCTTIVPQLLATGNIMGPIPSAWNGPSPRRYLANQKPRLSFRREHWRAQLLNAEWSWAVDLARRVVVSTSCQVQEVDPYLYLVFRTRRL